MTATAIADVPTGHASRYLQQLCKHWQHSLNVEFTPEHGTITFPRDARGANWDDDGKATLDAKDKALTVRLDASNADHLEGLKGVLERHLDRFAFREAPLSYDWQAG
ncbi:DUF2218 domain-containing protein [Stakelama sediminis]|uniref:DUF2218 domain-containing protein n=1 Tax=Stakelama sediminis TaxID=463200 RepID=A0A840YWJ2_9SPHN|nr:DUF2218 domain-containing protein [Stakelama sediminis]MBB5717919.1 hypothetical protein [Stakelama sediminis]